MLDDVHWYGDRAICLVLQLAICQSMLGRPKATFENPYFRRRFHLPSTSIDKHPKQIPEWSFSSTRRFKTPVYNYIKNTRVYTKTHRFQYATITATWCQSLPFLIESRQNLTTNGRRNLILLPRKFCRFLKQIMICIVDSRKPSFDIKIKTTRDTGDEIHSTVNPSLTIRCTSCNIFLRIKWIILSSDCRRLWRFRPFPSCRRISCFDFQAKAQSFRTARNNKKKLRDRSLFIEGLVPKRNGLGKRSFLT